MKHKVLVVDDEEYIRQIIKEILTDDLSLEVEVAHNGMDGLVCASETTYSIIITDIRMPRMTGLEFVRTLRSREIPNKNTPVIMLSAYSDSMKKEVESIPNTVIAEKPLAIRNILDTVESIIKKADQPG